MLKRARTDQRRAELQAELNIDPLPKSAQFVWATFCRISNRRGSNAHGPNRIAWTDLQAFGALTGIALSPWDIAVIEAIDDLYIAEAARELRATLARMRSKK